MAENVELARKEMMEVVSFVLDDKEYGLKIDFVKEVIRFRKITRVPGAPSFIKGVINLRGNIVPVIDLRLKLLGEMTESEKIEIMICEFEENQFGIIVDDVQEVVRLDQDHVEKMETSESQDQSKVIEGIGKLDQRLISVLRVRELLDWVGNSGMGA